jgi:hypothetical protein
MSLTASLNLSRTESRPTFTNSITINGAGTGGTSVETDISGAGINEKARVRLPAKRINRTASTSGLPSALTLIPVEPTTETAPTEVSEMKIPEPLSPDETQVAPAPLPTPRKVLPSSSSVPPPEYDERVVKFEHRLLEILITIFSSEAKLVANIVDTSKNIILNKADLVELISMLTGTNCVDIITAPIIGGCISRFKLFDQIERIFVDGVDFLITRNAEFNYITQYKVSLDKCFDK